MTNADRRDVVQINLGKKLSPVTRTRRHGRPSGSGNDDAELDCNNVLNRIQAPRRWEVNGMTYRQTISNQSPVGSDAKRLGEKLDTCLERFEVRAVGICPIKREIYTQCFDEVIRQTTLNCAERGFVLIKIRDRTNAIIDHNQKLFESVTAYGIRKALLIVHEKDDLEKRAGRLKTDNVRLRAELAKTAAARARLEREKAARRDAENERRAKELDELKQINDELKDQMLSMIFKT